MRLTSLAVAALVALAALGPRAARAEDGARDGAALASTPVDPAPPARPAAGFAAATPPDLDAAERLTVEQATAQAAAADADARAAAAGHAPAGGERAGGRRGARGARRSREPVVPEARGRDRRRLPGPRLASLLFRPVSHVRFFAGPTWGYVGWGVQGGVVLVPWNAWIAPDALARGREAVPLRRVVPREGRAAACPRGLSRS